MRGPATSGVPTLGLDHELRGSGEPLLLIFEASGT